MSKERIAMRQSKRWAMIVGLAAVATDGTGTTAGTGETQTLKIGMVLDFGFPLHVDWQKEMDALVPAVNAAGGIDIGGQKYQLEIIMEDSKSNAETARAAVEKLVNQDKVKFILGDETVDGWLSVTEPAGVLVIANTPTPGILQPANKLAFNAGYFRHLSSGTGSLRHTPISTLLRVRTSTRPKDRLRPGSSRRWLRPSTKRSWLWSSTPPVLKTSVP
jgi:hypothetical protein